MSTVQSVLDRRADGIPYEDLALAFREFDRWTGDDPRLLVAEAAAATTGQRFVGGIEPAVSRFRETFVETGRIDSFADVAALDIADEDLVSALGARRKRHVLLEVASVLSNRPEDDDLAALRGWAAEADQYRHEEDPVGSISGVGPSSFQLLRQLAGVDAVTPDRTVVRLLEAIGSELETSPLETATDRLTIASCEWLALESTYRPLEIDRIAWWTFTDEDERRAELDASGLVGVLP
ncbi:hypothetical protein [Natrarchaeobius chitinivorans]|uniref:DNA-3-methyladenine glycosylase 2 family protein n=1 Tax=Natrarchaeobius chitinivorans TaxID=1679083 RepID=A0A3N6M6M8_NATCH|nr:hypothetical protein [Natrarchaeobius chitinivorans]RQG97857.1 hypothetical protein EA473_01245 [Natrarchaeobius chitinivorans]